MHNFLSRSNQKWEPPIPAYCSESRIQFVLHAEKEILHLISARIPIREILDRICTALDCQIENSFSLVSFCGQDEANAVDVAQTATLFGLYHLTSSNFAADDGREIGALEIYCCVPRNLSPREVQWIERASCLAAVAIQRDRGARRDVNLGDSKSSLPPANAFKWPLSTN